MKSQKNDQQPINNSSATNQQQEQQINKKTSENQHTSLKTIKINEHQ